MPNPSVATVLQLETESEKKKIKAAVQLHPVCHVGLQFSIKGEEQYTEKSRYMSQVPCMFGGESGGGHLLTMEPHWWRLGGHHKGATEGEDSQELQG